MKAIIEGIAAAIGVATSWWGTVIFLVVMRILFESPWYVIFVLAIIWYWGGYVIGMALLAMAKDMAD